MRLDTEEQQLKAVRQNGYAIGFIDNPSEAVKLAAVKQNGHLIESIEDPSEAVQLEAVKQNGHAIYYIKDPPEAVQLAAVRQDWWAIQCISKRNQILIIKKLLSEGHQFSENFIRNYKDLYEKANLELEVENSLEREFS
jgi:hypothetical protein